MTEDFFSLLGESRRPWLDPEQIKETFHRLSRTEHPDQQTAGGKGESNADFARLNQAQSVLRDPKARLRHLLELEHPEIKLSGPADVPATLADLFAPIHGLLRETDELLAKRASAPSALAKALLARQEWALRERVEQYLAELDTLQAAALTELRAFDDERSIPSLATAARLHDFYQRFAYLSRWTEQLRERLFQLGT